MYCYQPHFINEKTEKQKFSARKNRTEKLRESAWYTTIVWEVRTGFSKGVWAGPGMSQPERPRGRVFQKEGTKSKRP